MCSFVQKSIQKLCLISCPWDITLFIVQCRGNLLKHRLSLSSLNTLLYFVNDMSLNEAGHATIAAYKENVFSVFLPFLGPEDPSNRKNTHHFLKPNFRKFQDDSKNVSLRIGSKWPQKLGLFFSLFLMRKRLSSGQKWFLRPYFPLIRGMFLFRSGLRFLDRE